MSDDLALIDSNLLTYVFDKSEPEKHSICKSIVSDCWSGKRGFAVSIQNLSEFYVVVTKKIEKPITKEIAQKFIEYIINFRGWHILNFNALTVISAIDINEKYGIHYWDALLAATMRENNVFSIYTENGRDFKRVPWIKTQDPFEIRQKGY